jgi:rhamnosyltransferase
MRISVVIPTLNAGPQFARLLESLQRQSPKPPDEIIVIDSGSRDQTCELARQAGARVVPIFAPFNHGLTRDEGVAAASGDIVFLTVQDAVPASSDWLAKVAAHFDDPKVAGVTTRQIPPPDGPLELQIKADLEAQESAGPERVSLFYHPGYARYKPSQRLELYRFDNVCSALRRSVWQQIPFGACRYAEDYQWAKKALEAGHMIVRDPSAPVIHAHTRPFWYEFRRGLLDAWVLDDAFGFRYSQLRKLNRIGLLFKRRPAGPSSTSAQNGGRGGGRWHACKTYAAHALARSAYTFWRFLLKPCGLGRKTMTRLTSGI